MMINESRTMKKINIEIPDNLNNQQEVFAIAHQLSKRMIGGGVKMIGDSVDVIDLKTQITVTRKSTEKPIVMIDCILCKTSCEKKIAYSFFVNYGGVVSEKFACSKDCRSEMLNILGSRASVFRSKMKSPITR